MNKKYVFLSTAYLAPVEYYVQLANVKNIIIEKHDNYVKQTYRNRCVIASANGLQILSIPILKSKSYKSRTQDICIDEYSNWRRLHWNTFIYAYNSSPFFQYYESVFRPFYEKKQKFLYDFNEKLRELICSLLSISPNIFYTSIYRKNIGSNGLDLREKIHPKQVPFVKNLKSYYQVYENKYGFQSNLSIVDLLFNVGTEAIFYLNIKKSR